MSAVPSETAAEIRTFVRVRRKDTVEDKVVAALFSMFLVLFASRSSEWDLLFAVIANGLTWF